MKTCEVNNSQQLWFELLQVQQMNDRIKELVESLQQQVYENQRSMSVQPFEMEDKAYMMGTETATEEFSEEQRTKQTQEQIANQLVKMGFRRGQVGFNNIVLSIYEVSRVPRGQQIRVTSEIYPRVAAYFGSSVYSVERTIRNAIESVWKRSNLSTLEELYPYPCDNLNGRPTNAEFLINMGVKYRPA